MSEHWKARGQRATRGNQSRLGALFNRACGLDDKDSVPRFSGQAVITSDGYVLCDFWGRDGVFHRGAFVSSVADLVRNVEGLAEHLKLTDTERAEYLEKWRLWIILDYRHEPRDIFAKVRS